MHKKGLCGMIVVMFCEFRTYEIKKGLFFEAKVVLSERGVVRFSHHRATGWMNGRCDKTNFWPLIGSPSQNEHLIFNFLELTPSPYQWENHYYVRVE